MNYIYPVTHVGFANGTPAMSLVYNLDDLGMLGAFIQKGNHPTALPDNVCAVYRLAKPTAIVASDTDTKDKMFWTYSFGQIRSPYAVFWTECSSSPSRIGGFDIMQLTTGRATHALRTHVVVYHNPYGAEKGSLDCYMPGDFTQAHSYEKWSKVRLPGLKSPGPPVHPV